MVTAGKDKKDLPVKSRKGITTTSKTVSIRPDQGHPLNQDSTPEGSQKNKARARRDHKNLTLGEIFSIMQKKLVNGYRIRGEEL
jgi:hypothetical protein